jgi:hypothetical protein
MFGLLLLVSCVAPPHYFFVGPHSGCGTIPPALLAGTPGPTVSPADLKRWKEYVAELDLYEQQALNDLWAAADFAGRVKLLGLLDKLRTEEKKKRKEKEKDKEAKPADGKE